MQNIQVFYGGPVMFVVNFFLQSEIALKQKTTNNYLLYIFVITIASINFHDFSLDMSPAVLLKLIICFFSSRCFIILY